MRAVHPAHRALEALTADRPLTLTPARALLAAVRLHQEKAVGTVGEPKDADRLQSHASTIRPRSQCRGVSAGAEVDGAAVDTFNAFDTSRVSLADGSPNPEFTRLVADIKRKSGLELPMFLVIFTCMILMRFGL